MRHPSMSVAPISPGVVFGLLAFGLWGFGPLYFKAVELVAAPEVLAHRIIWSLLFLLPPLLMLGKWHSLQIALRDRQLLLGLLLSSMLLALNWLTFIYAVTSGQVLAASMGYFILPLFNLILARLFFNERLNLLQTFAVGLAVAGVANQLFNFGSVPWIALSLSITFGFYGLIRKKCAVDPVLGLTVETLLLLPLAVGYLVWLALQGEIAFLHQGLRMDLLLLLAGPVSALPLLLFAAAVNRLRYGTVALMQYLAPSMTFLLGVWVFGEPFGQMQLITFGLIWSALVLFTMDGQLQQRRQRSQLQSAERAQA